MERNELNVIYKRNLEQGIIEYLVAVKKMPRETAMDIYYRSKLAEQIQEGQCGIENLDEKYLAEDLMENEPQLFEGLSC